jgi:hypothetical protein
VSHAFSGGNVVFGTSPGRTGQTLKTPIGDIPVFNAVREGLDAGFAFNTGVIYLPPAGARDGVAELARGGRVYVVIQRERINQRLAEAQLQFLLDELFDASEEISFRFPDYSSYDPRAEAGYAVGERIYREDSSAEPVVERIFVGARSEHGRWVLTELRLTTE